jgi:hypothetical protein
MTVREFGRALRARKFMSGERVDISQNNRQPLYSHAARREQGWNCKKKKERRRYADGAVVSEINRCRYRRRPKPPRKPPATSEIICPRRRST